MIEALLTVLVISIGCLGLGRFQVQLAQAAGDLHTRGAARLFALNLYELNTTGWVAADAATINRIRPGTGNYLNFNNNLHLSGNIVTRHVSVSWKRPAGRGRIAHSSVDNPGIRLTDNRFLIPPSVSR